MKIVGGILRVGAGKIFIQVADTIAIGIQSCIGRTVWVEIVPEFPPVGDAVAVAVTQPERRQGIHAAPAVGVVGDVSARDATAGLGICAGHGGVFDDAFDGVHLASEFRVR